MFLREFFPANGAKPPSFLKFPLMLKNEAFGYPATVLFHRFAGEIREEVAIKLPKRNRNLLLYLNKSLHIFNGLMLPGSLIKTHLSPSRPLHPRIDLRVF